MVLAACGNGMTSDSTGETADTILSAPASNDRPGSKLPAAEVEAIIALGQTGADRPPETGHGHHHGGEHSPVELSPQEQAALDTELDVARGAVTLFDTTEKAAALGYVLATAPSPGIGTHWVLWSQIREPFDAATPSMLLFDHRASPPVLVGYSYAVQSPDEPEGFSGAADEWHRHTGICVALSGWVIRERSSGPDDCDGSYIAGGDFWMLHAWVVPGWDNRDGMFAPANPKLCPADTGPDFLRCVDQSKL